MPSPLEPTLNPTVIPIDKSTSLSELQSLSLYLRNLLERSWCSFSGHFGHQTLSSSPSTLYIYLFACWSHIFDNFDLAEFTLQLQKTNFEYRSGWMILCCAVSHNYFNEPRPISIGFLVRMIILKSYDSKPKIRCWAIFVYSLYFYIILASPEKYRGSIVVLL